MGKGSALISRMERLELRQLLCGDGFVHPTGQAIGQSHPGVLDVQALQSASAANAFVPVDFKVAINFSPPSVNPPAGYARDNGSKFAKRPNKMFYGWNTSISSKTVQRNNPSALDMRYDTFAQFNNANKWEIQVPNGTYHVRYSVGDPSATGVVFRINVEGQFSLSERTSGKSTFIERGITVNVIDGRLTLTSPSAETQKINWIIITGQTTPPPPPLPLAWSKSSLKTTIGKNETRGLQIGNKIYVMGGFTDGFHKTLNNLDIFDLGTQTWSKGASLPGAQSHAGIATDGKYIYYVSGQYGTRFGAGNVARGTKESWRYEIAANKWETFVSLPGERFAPGLVHLDGKLYCFGGAGPDRIQSTNDTFVLDLKNTAAGWTKAAPMLIPADHFGVTTYNGKIYAVGGEHDHSRGYAQHDFLLSYDPSTNKWARLADLPTHSSHFESSLFVRDGKIWVIGGTTDGLAKLKEVRAYDPANNTWTMYAPLPRGSDSGVIGIKGDRLWYLGGQTLDAGGITDVYTATLPSTAKVLRSGDSIFSAARSPLAVSDSDKMLWEDVLG